ncbi:MULTISPECIES: hypothetical protein [unclassified Brevundimonas]|uniref:hypothetical protein n=1 Tax=unclassified Brevundimonas TaxID=2622653 RepID=UPI003F912D1F
MIDIARRAATPWHLWLVGVLSLLWSAVGGFDFVQTNTRGEAYMRENGFSDAMIAYFTAMPTWMYVPWTLGVWGAVLGSLLLLARSRWAVHVFAISLIGAVVSLIYQKAINPPPPLPATMQVMGWMPYVIVVIALFLLWYAWTMAKRGVLR